MDANDKQYAEAVLRHLFVGTQIYGIGFGPVLQIVFTDIDTSQKPVVQGQRYIHLSSNWKVYESRPLSFPDHEEDLPELSEEEQIRLICSLRKRQVVKVELGASQPHIILTFADGTVFFLNGRHEMYECWVAGVSCGKPNELWMIVACPGGGVAIWTPDSFVA